AWDSCSKGLGKLELNPQTIDRDIDQCWEVLAEPVQTVMRRHGLPEPYEQLKALTRGRGITQDALREFIEWMQLPDDAKQRLLNTTTLTYIGRAGELAAKF